MHWFKIVLIVVLITGIVNGLCEVGKGDYKKDNKSWVNFTGAIINGLLLWGLIVYL